MRAARPTLLALIGVSRSMYHLLTSNDVISIVQTILERLHYILHHCGVVPYNLLYINYNYDPV